MKIKYAMGFNWGNFTNLKFPFEDGMNLAVGESGSGKSTLIDLIQSVMTAAHDDITTYNAGQTDETSRKQTKEYRTFASYLLGADQMRFTRKEAIGSIAVVFEDREGKMMTAWVLGRAVLGGNGEHKKAQGGVESMGICFGHALEPEDFLTTQNDSSKIVKDKEKLHKYLKDTYKKDSEIYSSKKDYIRRLYGAFLGKRNSSYEEAQKAAKAFVKYIHPTQTDDVHKFVKEELLDKKDLDGVVKHLKEIIQTYKRIEKEAEITRRASESLKKSVMLGDTLLQKWKDYHIGNYIFNKKKEIYQLHQLDENNKKLLKQQSRFEKLKSEINNINETLALFNKERDSLNKRLSDSDVSNKKNLLEEKIALKEKEISSSVGNFQNSISKLIQAYKLYTSYKEHLSGVAKETEHLFSEMEQYLSPDYAFDKNGVERLDEIYIQIKPMFEENGIIYTTLVSERDKYSDIVKSLNAKRADINIQVESYKSIGRTIYPNQSDIDLINERYPEADAKPLCEYLDLTDRSWQQAVEAYIGSSRFSIVVSSSFEVKAAELLLENKKRSRVIQGSLVLKDMQERTKEVSFNSIVNLLKFSHSVAEAFILMNYANVIQVKNKEELRYTRRGLTKDGLGSSGYTMYPCLENVNSCYIGEKTKQERFEILNKELEELNKKVQTFSTPMGVLSGIVYKVSALSLISPYEAYRDTSSLQQELESAKRDLGSLDISGLKEIEESISDIDKKIKEQNNLHTSLIKEQSEAELLSKSYMENIIRFEDEHNNTVDVVLKMTDSIKQMTAFDSRVDFEELDKEVKKNYKEISIIPSFSESVKEYFYPYKESAYIHNRSATQNTLMKELPESIKDDIDSFNDIYIIYKDHISLLDVLSNNILVKKQKQIDEQREIFDKSLKEEFCNRVYTHILDGKRKINDINRILGRHKFGEESFKIKNNLTPEFKQYYDYFEYLAQSRMHYQYDDENNEFTEARERLEELLLGDEDNSSMRELYRVADYRNYYDYDIHKILNDDHENSRSLNKFATDSGGQAETSYYVIRSIAAFSAFDKDIDDPKSKGIGFLLVDEGFKRIDDVRPAKILKYLLDDLGFQIITAMPPRNEGIFAEFITGHYDIFKEIVDATPKNFKVITHAQYTVYNQKPISNMIKRDKEHIQMELSFEQ